MIDNFDRTKKILLITVSALIVITLGFIWVNSMISQDKSASESQAVYEVVKPVFDATFGEDVITHDICRKLAHATEFMALGAELVCLYMILNRGFSVRFIEVFSYGLFVAVIDESIQILSKRGSQVKDVLIDYLGYLIGIVCAYIVFLIIKTVKDKKKQ